MSFSFIIPMIIAISGLHGTGKSVVGKVIADHFGLAYYSTGELFRNIAKEKGLTLEQLSRQAEKDHTIDNTIDYRIKQLALKGNCVLDNQLSPYLLKDIVEYSILLTCDRQVRINRMMERDSDERVSKAQETEIREASERKRFLEFYGVDIADPQLIQSTFNLILDTTNLTIQDVISKIMTAIQQYDGFSSEDPKN
jgi:CMP/dCMP kinase